MAFILEKIVYIFSKIGIHISMWYLHSIINYNAYVIDSAMCNA